ncbi:Tom6p SCDLUD_003173 [Saccharomycodes ludwigii]|uniref:Tom6p n=1 Tax=Saccharomycodes ludwigii TaxID=36035 RepID=UPI001E84C4EC|nr:hypothetical protein SCDLUD_003173 [Saccharomycodes ludwigii]KAH3900202.1 hypothetical protein SCDLUD_003173 [Saccharomycodes ludwigii]
MSAAQFMIPGLDASASEKQNDSNKSRFQLFRESPAWTVLVNVALFGAGVAFIQSPLMDMMAPQL